MASVNLFTLDIEGQCVERDPLDLLDAGQDKDSSSSHHDWGASAEPGDHHGLIWATGEKHGSGWSFLDTGGGPAGVSGRAGARRDLGKPQTGQ